jgi:hypothetical protein
VPINVQFTRAMPTLKRRGTAHVKVPLSPVKEGRLSLVVEQLRSKRRKGEETLEEKANSLTQAISSSLQPVLSTAHKVEASVNLSDHRDLSAVNSFVSMLGIQSRDAIMALPQHDTPQIERNKTLRMENDEAGRRRSSLARGRRSSAALLGLCRMYLFACG